MGRNFSYNLSTRFNIAKRNQIQGFDSQKNKNLPSKDLMCFFWAVRNAVLNSSLALTSAPASINNSTDLQIQDKTKENLRI